MYWVKWTCYSVCYFGSVVFKCVEKNVIISVKVLILLFKILMRNIFYMFILNTDSDWHTVWFWGRRSYILTSECITRARTWRSVSTCCCTLTSKSRTYGGVRSQVFTGARLLTRYVWHKQELDVQLQRATALVLQSPGRMQVSEIEKMSSTPPTNPITLWSDFSIHQGSYGFRLCWPTIAWIGFPFLREHPQQFTVTSGFLQPYY